MNVPGLKEFIGNYMIASLVIMLVAYCIHEFATRMRNKTKARKRQQVICRGYKNTFTVDCNAFMKEYYSTQEYIGQSKNRKIELIRVVG